MELPDEAPDQRRLQDAPADEPTVVESGPLETNLTAPVREVGPGTQISRYIVLHELGRGGMGVVYAAFDPQLDRKVALKLLHRRYAGVTDSRGEPHILREAKALAKLSHPNVVQVYDAGTHEGRVFMAMEFVDGKTFRRWTQAEPRSFEERLRACLAAGRGLHAAHLAGIVHRDFKPDNVLIGNDGRVLVVDFGLAEAKRDGVLTPSSDDSRTSKPRGSARAASAEDDPARTKIDGLPALVDPPALDLATRATGTAPAKASAKTRTGLSHPSSLSAEVGGTPVYMAPELRDGAEPGVASDLFAFAVTMHEAIYTVRPFAERKSKALYEAVREQKYQDIPGNLDAPAWLRKLILRGVDFDPTARWPDVAQMVDAIERARVHRRRRRWVFGAATVAGLAGLAWVATRDASTSGMCTTGAREVAEVWNAERAAAVKASFARSDRNFANDSAEHVLEGLDDYGDKWARMRDATCAATRVDGVQSEATLELRMACLDRGLDAYGSLVGLLVKADDRTVRNAVAAVYGLADVSGCADVAALESEQALPDDPGQRERVRELRAQVARARVAAQAGHFKEAREQLDIAREASLDLNFAPLNAEIERARGNTLELAGERDAARDALLESVLAAERGRQPLSEARAYIDLVSLVRDSPQLRAAAREWVRHAEALVSASPPTRDLEAALLFAQAELAYVEERYDRHLRLHREALALREAELGARHPEVFNSLRAVGTALQATGAYAESLPYLRRALELTRESYGDKHPRVAAAISSLALGYDWLGARAEARAHYLEAIELWDQSLGPMHPDVAAPLNNLAGIDYAQGNYEAARASFARALNIYESAYGEDHADVALALGNLGLVLDAMGQSEAAEKHHERALAIRTRVYGPRHIDTAISFHNLGDHYAERGELELARENLEAARSILTEKLGRDHPDLAEVHASLGRMYAREGQWDDAETSHRRSLELWRGAFGPDHISIAGARSELGQVALGRGDFETAERELSAALSLYELNQATDVERAGAQFALAKARFANGGARELWEGDARRALSAYASLGTVGDADRLEVQTWLDTHAAVTGG